MHFFFLSKTIPKRDGTKIRNSKVDCLCKQTYVVVLFSYFYNVIDLILELMK